MISVEDTSNADKGVFPQARIDAMTKASREFRSMVSESTTRVDHAVAMNFLGPAGKRFYNAMRDDSAESIWFARQLESIRPGLLEVQYPKLKGKQWVPVNNEIDNGAEQYTVQSVDKVGEATVTSDYAEDAPASDVLAHESSQLLRSIRTSYRYSVQDMRRSMLAGRPLDVAKAMAARDTVERRLDDIIFNGYAAAGLFGLSSLTTTRTYTIPNGAAGSKQWSKKTALEVLADLNGFVTDVISNSKGIEEPDFLGLALSGYNEITTRPIGLDANKTIAQFFLEHNPSVRTLDWSHKLETAGTGATRLMVAFTRDRNKIEAGIPQEFEQFAPQQRGMMVLTECHARSGGVVPLFPQSISQAYGF
jgi:hypothetical protein